jgi:hypothetical protein
MKISGVEQPSYKIRLSEINVSRAGGGGHVVRRKEDINPFGRCYLHSRRGKESEITISLPQLYHQFLLFPERI